MCITVIYIHTCVGLKHYDKFFKYPNSLFYNEVHMISIRLLHPHNTLIFVASANFLLCMHTPSSLSPSLSILSIAHIYFVSLGRSPRVSTTPFQHTPIDKPIQRCLPTAHTHLQSPPLCVLASCLSYSQTHV